MQFSFTTNIEKRSPWTGNVYFVDRMTSSYAVAHPFDVDGFLEDVYQKYEQVVKEDAYALAHRWNKSREELRRLWNRTMQMPVRGDKTVCPYKQGDAQPALMEVWHKACEYWRSGLRIGDVLPAIVPGHTITRLGNGEWIALFPKDMGLLENHENEIKDYICNTTEQVNRESDAEEHTEDSISIRFEQESECVGMTCSDILADATDTTEQAADIEAFEAECSENVPLEDILDAVEDAPMTGAQTEAERFVRPSRQEIQQQRRMTWAERQQREAQEAEDEERRQQRRKVLAAVGATIATLVLVNYFGLIGPALFGLVAGGLLKG